MIHDEKYWNDRYQTGQTQWDAGAITTPLKAYFDQLEDKQLKILIPGCGNACEAAYLWDNGFKNTFLVDISAYPLNEFKKHNPDFPATHLLHRDFFNLNDHFDLIIEQTFFCALHPSERSDYAAKCSKLLKGKGRLVGVLFDDPLFDNHPPYGGDKEDYVPFFLPYFHFNVFEQCYNSIKPRQNRELFINLSKKVGE